MDKIKSITVVLILITTTIACGNKAPKQDDMDWAYHDSVSKVRDSIERAEERNRLDSIIKENEKKRNESNSYSPSPNGSSHNQKKENMRGFDPASEDDMDDNGMSRYMENNDEEGWD